MNGTDPNPGQTLATLGGAVLVNWGYPYVACFAPSIYYANNPDPNHNPQFPATGYFPGGALGIWQPTDTNGQACAPAQLNLDLTHVSGYSQFALALAAEAQYLAGSNFPTRAGGSADVAAAMAALLQKAGLQVSVSKVTISYDGTTYTYTINFSLVASGTTTTASVVLSHTAGATQYNYAGLLYYQFDFGTPGIAGMKAGTIRYRRNGPASLDLRARMGQYVTGTSPALDSNNELDPAGNWQGGMELFTASFNPISAWLTGSFVEPTRLDMEMCPP